MIQYISHFYVMHTGQLALNSVQFIGIQRKLALQTSIIVMDKVSNLNAFMKVCFKQLQNKLESQSKLTVLLHV